MTGVEFSMVKREVVVGEEKNLRDRLVRLLEDNNTDLDFQLKDDTSLIRSGFLDSIGLFNLALWIEKEVG